MSETKQETENTCPKEAAFRYTWPGRDESYICADHAAWLCQVAAAIGLYQQLLPIENPNHKGITCRQQI